MHPAIYILSLLSITTLALGGLTGCGGKRVHIATSSGTPEQEIPFESNNKNTEPTSVENADTSLSESELSSMISNIEPTADKPSDSFSSVMPNEPVNMAHKPRTVASENSTPYDDPPVDPHSSLEAEITTLEDTSSSAALADSSPSSISDPDFIEDLSNPTQGEHDGIPLSEGQNLSAQSNSSLEVTTSNEANALDHLENTAELRTDINRLRLEPSADQMDAPFVQETSNEVESVFPEEEIARAPETFEIATVQPSDNLQDQNDRIKKEELATTAAGLQDVFFPFDSWTLTKEGKRSLKSTIDWFKHDFSSVLIIEGHSDQRGTQAYNMILGKRRALAVREYLSQSGIDPSHLITISYGKDKPFCQDITEVCHQLNRRGHLLVQNP